MTKFRVEAARGKLRPGFGKLMEITVQCIGARKDATYRAVRQYGFIFIFNRMSMAIIFDPLLANKIDPPVVY